ncbi:hypothetical protein [Sulfurovum mangrovi]|uniref:hypothetical protein n=1 Tax=Sulfurovum mangrovi TaxID=2893889 RepID=UPI001E535DBC|nr:hypothetical protein [Sulfurovum mangrovi]UFH59835.1 hypothetical protein LN246_03080 [Sulfurovum mangrovi]UFH59886.1 hypothetical protein LN246_03340 [Sulfurovum mangrovi]
MIEAELFAHLKDNVLSVSERVYPLILPKGCKKPALVYSIVIDNDKRSMSEGGTFNVTRAQIDVYADTHEESVQIKNEVKAALYSFEHHVFNVNTTSMFEEEFELFRQLIDFNIRS